jgi:hypothetical protein
MPMTPLTGDLGKARLAVLERYADPRCLLAAGDGELTRLIITVSGHQQGPQRAGQRRAAAAAAAGLYGDHPAVPYDELAAEVATKGSRGRGNHHVEAPQQADRGTRRWPRRGGRSCAHLPAAKLLSRFLGA